MNSPYEAVHETYITSVLLVLSLKKNISGPSREPFTSDGSNFKNVIMKVWTGRSPRIFLASRSSVSSPSLSRSKRRLLCSSLPWRRCRSGIPPTFPPTILPRHYPASPSLISPRCSLPLPPSKASAKGSSKALLGLPSPRFHSKSPILAALKTAPSEPTLCRCSSSSSCSPSLR